MVLYPLLNHDDLRRWRACTRRFWLYRRSEHMATAKLAGREAQVENRADVSAEAAVVYGPGVDAALRACERGPQPPHLHLIHGPGWKLLGTIWRSNYAPQVTQICTASPCQPWTTHDTGGFHASLAADDPQGREGHFYVWESDPLRLVLSPFEWDVCAAHWGLVDAPNVEGHTWHLHVARPAAKLASTLDRPEALVQELIASARDKLLIERDKRDHPPRDAKVLTGWTALMITGLARAATVCQRPDWLKAARAALGFLRLERWVDDGCTSGRLHTLPGQDAFLDDHAFLLEAVLALHEADPQADDLPFAEGLARAMLAQFEDRDMGGFFFTRHEAPALIHRLKTAVDSATPSGNGVSAQALLALSGKVAAPNAARYRTAAERCLRVFAATVRADPASCSSMLRTEMLLNR